MEECTLLKRERTENWGEGEEEQLMKRRAAGEYRKCGFKSDGRREQIVTRGDGGDVEMNAKRRCGSESEIRNGRGLQERTLREI